MFVEQGGILPRTTGGRAALHHPDVTDIDLLAVLHALSDETRMALVRRLAMEDERACGTFAVDVGPSTLSHHFKVLREAGVIRQRHEGTRRLTSLRVEDLHRRFPGLLDAVLDAADRAGLQPAATADPAPSNAQRR
jgi:DNA-binding transcriptional ArsR family regulator